MKLIITFLLFIFLISLMPQRCIAQGETAVPFLLFPSSPEGNGMGGIAGSLRSEHPMSVLANPGQLGIMSLDHYFLGSVYPSATTWLPGLRGSNLTYFVTASNIGLNINKLNPLPFGLSVGIAYSRINYSLGTFVETGANGPSVLSTFEAEEHSTNWSIAIGIDYFIKMGIGYTLKSVESDLAPFNVQGQGRQGVANVTAYDVGMITEVPVMSILAKVSGTPLILFKSIEPLLNITFGYAHTNLGDNRVAYIDANHGDPLPRNAMMGMSYTAGVTLQGPTAPWEALSFTLARQAEDILVQSFPAPTDSNGFQTGDPPPSQYVDGSGAIQFFNNVVLGEGNNRVTLRKGWQVNLGEFLIIRGGSVMGRGVSYTTEGYGLRIAGLMKLFENLFPSFSTAPAAVFFISHFDIRYDHASNTYDDPSNLNNGITYNGLSLVVK